MCYEYEWYEKARLAEQARRMKERSKDDRKNTEPQIPAKQGSPVRPAKEPIPA